MTRQEANLLILSALEKYFNDYPDIRFTQALSNLTVSESTTIDYDFGFSAVEIMDYYEESEATLKKIKSCQEQEK